MGLVVRSRTNVSPSTLTQLKNDKEHIKGHFLDGFPPDYWPREKLDSCLNVPEKNPPKYIELKGENSQQGLKP